MSLQAIIAVFLGGGIGSLCRFLVSLGVLRLSPSAFPWGTLTANVLSCVIMAGGLYYFADKLPEGSWQRLFIVVGLCGGFSTFSTFSLENFLLIKQGNFGFLILNILLSILLCLMVFWAMERAEGVGS
ncbi:MAG: fluoride efflux transporter CrcB [Flavobacteriales bacterium]|nr:fluoride efflux transporter CrcB [Flavobacteriales bacterium]